MIQSTSSKAGLSRRGIGEWGVWKTILFFVIILALIGFLWFTIWRYKHISVLNPVKMERNCSWTLNIWWHNNKDKEPYSKNLQYGLDESVRDRICESLVEEHLRFFGGWNTICTYDNLNKKNLRYACRKGHSVHSAPIYQNPFAGVGLSANLHPNHPTSQMMCWQARVAICMVQEDTFASHGLGYAYGGRTYPHGHDAIKTAAEEDVDDDDDEGEEGVADM
eukprot:Nk52_evm1s1945 gene=Nk52_evmTU1s1945